MEAITLNPFLMISLVLWLNIPHWRNLQVNPVIVSLILWNKLTQVDIVLMVAMNQDCLPWLVQMIVPVLLRVPLHQRCYTLTVLFPVAQGLKSSNTSQIKILAMILPSNPKSSVSNAIDHLASVEPRSNILQLVLPASLQGVTQHHVDFIRCDNIDTADTAKWLMQQQ